MAWWALSCAKCRACLDAQILRFQIGHEHYLFQLDFRAVDELFLSLARNAGTAAVGALLTGMGRDGAKGLAALRRAGAWTAVESEESCVVFGMPAAAIALDAAVEVLPADRIGSRIVELTSG